jgi:hypothetical protein
MALDFPTSPTDGQIYNNYYWDDTNSRWQLLSDSLEVAADFSNTATGTYTSGYDYKYVSFTSSGTLTVTRGGYADVLLVGGGGGGGLGYGAGGGAGGHLYIENAYLPAGSLDVVVGAGGLGADSTGSVDVGVPGNNGFSSSLWKYFAPGGGGGAGNSRSNAGAIYRAPGLNGASGGGGASGPNTGGQGGVGGSGITGLGYAGGLALDHNAGAGGGGAGAVGANTANGVGGNGGAGVANSITGSSVTRAGGGGGGATTTPGTGGTGGGGAGSNAVTATSGTANTGGGGGGVRSADYDGGAGGSGIVIVRVRTN